jgi:hypothetical protein
VLERGCLKVCAATTVSPSVRASGTPCWAAAVVTSGEQLGSATLRGFARNAEYFASPASGRHRHIEYRSSRWGRTRDQLLSYLPAHEVRAVHRGTRGLCSRTVVDSGTYNLIQAPLSTVEAAGAGSAELR